MLKNRSWVAISAFVILIFVCAGTLIVGGLYLKGLPTLNPPKFESVQTIPLDSLSTTEHLTIGSGRIQQVAYSPDGKRMAVATSAAILLYETEAFQLQLSIPMTTWVYSILWSPDSRFIAAVVSNRFILLDAATGKQILVFEHSEGASLDDTMEWSPDGKYIAARVLLWFKAEVWIWEVSTGNRVEILKNRTQRFPHAEGVSWSDDSTELAVSYRYHVVGVGKTPPSPEIYIWNLRSSPRVGTKWDSANLLAGNLTRSPDGEYLFVSGEPGVQVLDIRNRSSPGKIPRGSSYIEAFSFSTDGKLLAVGRRREPVTVYELPSLKQVAALDGMWTGADSLSWSPHNQLVASSEFNHSVFVWSLPNRELIHQISLGSDREEDLAWSPDSAHVAAGGRDNRVRLYEASSGKLVTTLGEPYPGNRTHVDWSHDGHWIAWTGMARERNAGVAQIWSTDGTQSINIPGEGTEVPLAWSPRENSLALMAGDLQIWDVHADGNVHLNREIPVSGTVLRLDWSPDGKKIVAGVITYDMSSHERSANLQIWQAADGQLLAEISDETMKYIRGLAWSPNGQWIAASYDLKCTGEYCSMLQVWEAESGELVRTFGRQEGSAWKLSWSADSQWIVSTDAPHRTGVALYPMNKERSIREVPAHHGSVESVAWSPDGKKIASTGYDGQLFIWDAVRLTTINPVPARER